LDLLRFNDLTEFPYLPEFLTVSAQKFLQEKEAVKEAMEKELAEKIELINEPLQLKTEEDIKKFFDFKSDFKNLPTPKGIEIDKINSSFEDEIPLPQIFKNKFTSVITVEQEREFKEMYKIVDSEESSKFNLCLEILNQIILKKKDVETANIELNLNNVNKFRPIKKIIPKLIKIIRNEELEENIEHLKNVVIGLKNKEEILRMTLNDYQQQHNSCTKSILKMEEKANNLIKQINESLHKAKEVNNSYFYNKSALDKMPILKNSLENFAFQIELYKKELAFHKSAGELKLEENKQKVNLLEKAIEIKEEKLKILRQELITIKNTFKKKALKYVENLKKEKSLNTSSMTKILNGIIISLKDKSLDLNQIKEKILKLNQTYYNECLMYERFQKESDKYINETNKEIKELKDEKKSLSNIIKLQQQNFCDFLLTQTVSNLINLKPEVLNQIYKDGDENFKEGELQIWLNIVQKCNPKLSYEVIKNQFGGQLNFLLKQYNDTEEASLKFLELAGESNPLIFTPAFLKVAADFYNDILRNYKEKRTLIEDAYSHVDHAYQFYNSLLNLQPNLNEQTNKNNQVLADFRKVKEVMEKLNSYKGYKPKFLAGIKWLSKNDKIG